MAKPKSVVEATANIIPERFETVEEEPPPRPLYRKGLLEDTEGGIKVRGVLDYTTATPDQILERHVHDPSMHNILERAFAFKMKDIEEAEKTKELQRTYHIRPGLEERFKPQTVKEMIHGVLNEMLGEKTYSEAEADDWAKTIANTIRNKVRDMGFKRYKFMVQVLIGEQQGAGVKTASRCLWDADSDNYSSDIFLNKSMFCMAVVFAVYFY